MIEQFDSSSHFLNYRENIFQKTSENSDSYFSFLEKIQAACDWLNEYRIGKNDIIILTDPETEIYPVLIFALWKMGAIVFPLNPKLPSETIINICNQSKARYIIGSANTSLKSKRFINSDPVKYLLPGPQTSEFNISLEDTALMIMTSGSSGNPKYAVHTFRSLYYNALGVNSYFGLSEDDRWLVTLPFYHVGGFGILIRCFLAGAQYGLISAGKSLHDALQEFKPTHISLVFTQLQRLLKNNITVGILKKCKAVFLGGSAIPSSVIEMAGSLDINLYSGYGLTEMGSTVAIRNHKAETKNAAEILQYRDVEIRENEILLRGKCLFSGYLEKDRLNLTLRDGWFASGDLGIKRTNKITVIGRKDNMFISGGENIQPEEIEKTLMKMDGIEQALVVPVDNQEYGQRPVAFIKYSENTVLSEKKIKAFLRSELPSFKIPDKIITWPEQAEMQEHGGIKLKRSWFIEFASSLEL